MQKILLKDFKEQRSRTFVLPKSSVKSKFANIQHANKENKRRGKDVNRLESEANTVESILEDSFLFEFLPDLRTDA